MSLAVKYGIMIASKCSPKLISSACPVTYVTDYTSNPRLEKEMPCGRFLFCGRGIMDTLRFLYLLQESQWFSIIKLSKGAEL